jgi:subtilisin family serine protease
MQKIARKKLSLSLCLLALLAGFTAQARAEAVDDYLIQCRTSCDSVIAAVNQVSGAQINQVFRNVAGIAVTLPVAAAADLQTHTDVVNVTKDVPVNVPVPLVDQPLAADGVQELSAADLSQLVQVAPANYSFNNVLTGAATYHDQGKFGNGIVVAIIDSGTANSPVVPALAGSVIGGENLIPVAQDPVTSATSRFNDPHGTWVGTMIAGHANFLFANTSLLVRSLQVHAPDSVIPCTLLGCPPTLSVVPMVGQAPGAKLYALKVLPSNGAPSPSSRTLAAMDRLITIRRNFNNGVPSVPVNPGCGSENVPCVFDSLPIQVVNMSLGGGTVFAGGDLKDKLTEEMLNVGMVIVSSAGNDGPSALTIGSPASGRGALCVAAASTPAHERVLRDQQFGLGFGVLWRPFNGIQTATFSSRGPTPDGRYSVDITANGFASFVQGANGGISLASGTSFSSPSVAGGAVLLREQFPTASAVQIRNALIAGANGSMLADSSGRIDQGKGFLDIPAAAAKLTAGNVSSSLPQGLRTPSVTLNLLPLGIAPVLFHNDKVTKNVNLKPGQVTQLYVQTLPDIEQLEISFTNVTPALPPAQQNALFGDDIFLTVVDAYTSFAVPLVQDFVLGDQSYTINRPQAGLVRVAVQGDTTNAGNISAKVTIKRTRANLGIPTKMGLVREGEEDVVQVNVPAGTAQLSFLMSFLHDWGFWPTNDIDLIVEDPLGNPIFDGATIGSPERVEVANPMAGIWTARIVGFQITEEGQIFESDLWSLWAKADGLRLSPQP